MFKLSQSTSTTSRTIRIEGRLDSDGVGELLRLCNTAQSPSAVTLDLSGLLSADSRGLDMLAHLRARGFRLHAPSPYIATLLEETQS
ncbi:MAG: STAS domain-containing protein [Phycisphaeraceae bacterium]|nr:STAS domain-containing protein [Phycisphaeraceae bacterium]